MQSLEALTRDARALANGDVVPAAPLTGAESEVARQMQICNACRYCEGFCAVFPAMTRRLEFGKADIHFLANLSWHRFSEISRMIMRISFTYIRSTQTLTESSLMSMR